MLSSLIVTYEGSALSCDTIDLTYRSASAKSDSAKDVVLIRYQRRSGESESLKSVLHGQGKVLFCTGLCYEGHFVYGKMHGQGRMEWPNGALYEGEFVANMIQGKGTFTWPNGNQYSGHVKAGIRHGKGSFTFKRDVNGPKPEQLNLEEEVKCQICHYDGEWKEGLYDGWGTLIYDVDAHLRYEGTFVRGKRHGHGIIRYANGNWYEGAWADDQKSGFGVMTWKTVKQSLRNTDVLKSHALVTLEKYEGEWKNDVQDGIGRLVYFPSVSEGENVPDPSFSLCNWYQGEMKEGLRHGIGVFHYENGSRYEGEWQYNVKHGLGIFVSEDGRITVARYRRDHNIEVIHSSACSIPTTNAAMLGGLPLYIDDLGEINAIWRKSLVNATLRYNADLSSLYRTYSTELNDEMSRNPRPMMTTSECRGLLQDAQFDCTEGHFERLLNQVRKSQRKQAVASFTKSVEGSSLIQSLIKVIRYCQAVQWHTPIVSMKSVILYREFVELLIRFTYYEKTENLRLFHSEPTSLPEVFTQFIEQRLCPLQSIRKKESVLRKRLKSVSVQRVLKKHTNSLTKAFEYCYEKQCPMRVRETAKEMEIEEEELLFLVCDKTVSIRSLLEFLVQFKIPSKMEPFLVQQMTQKVGNVLFCHKSECNATESACQWIKDFCLSDRLSRTDFQEVIAVVAFDSMNSGESSSDSQFAAILDAFIATEFTHFSIGMEPDFIYKEIFGIYDIKATDGVHQERVQNFLTIPFHLESLMIFGIFLAMDSFLFIFTYLPMRLFFGFGSIFASSSHIQRFCRTHLYDVMVAWLLLIGVFVLLQVDMSRVYHAIRGQAMIKLYVLFTMIEVVTVHVAINSSNSSLLTLLISNNFAELKSCVFKKFEEQNLFQVSCSDIVERFKLLLFLVLILLQSMTRDAFYGTAMVMLAEMVIDWLKHAFITKFNQISPLVYSKFTTILCHDLTGWQNSNTILDHTHHVSKRLGLLSLPLACVVIRMLLKTMCSRFKQNPFNSDVSDPLEIPHGIAAFDILIAPLLATWSYLPSILIFFVSFLCLAALKMLLSLSLFIFAINAKQINSQKS
ncbi:unnamed protein product [Albugo candida]|uniref:Uncharacterized protein n=1 Tax=Albugo candida TaxID=65357 RepID=A0A024GSK8_9STRA|nr:unnamed protein product [Albugo candida]|eukprot:CCI49338.1 unnamed protein product [Albugo candida]